MSAQFKLAKKKFSQHDLRKMMHDQKQKVATKIDSPLAKYNDLGQLTCILCQSIVRSEDVWKVHINAKQHKQNVEIAKKLKQKTNNFTSASAGIKRPATPPLMLPPEQPPKKLKGILKNSLSTITSAELSTSSSSQKSGIPADFFDAKSSIETNNFFEATLQKTTIRKDLLNIKSKDKVESGGENGDASTSTMKIDNSIEKDDTLPEGFFDDPVKDAKARNLEYKDPIEEEWERFQKEIKAASNFSNAIIAEDQEESTTERQIDEIDEQIRNWSRVLRLEKKKERVVDSKEKKSQTISKTKIESGSDEDDDAYDEDFDEFLDWRSKKSHK